MNYNLKKEYDDLSKKIEEITTKQKTKSLDTVSKH